MLVNQEDHVNSYSNPITHAGMCTMSSPSPVSWQQLEDSCSNDAVTTALRNLITAGTPDDKSLWPPEMAEYHRHRHLLTVLGPAVLYKDRAIIPTDLRKEILDTLHSAHQGTTGMTSRACSAVFWPHMQEDILRTRQACSG